MRVCKKKKERICNKSNHYLKYLVELREFQSLIVLGQKLNHGKHHFGQGWTKLFLDYEQSLLFFLAKLLHAKPKHASGEATSWFAMALAEIRLEGF